MLLTILAFVLAIAALPQSAEAQIKYPARTGPTVEEVVSVREALMAARQAEAEARQLQAELEALLQRQAEAQAAPADSSFVPMPPPPVEEAPAKSGDESAARLLGQGQISYSGKPELEADLLQFFIMPDGASWDNIIIPIVLSTSAPSFSDVLSEAEAAADLLGISTGTAQLDANILWERRDTLENGEPAISGLYGKVGGAVKMNVASAEGAGRDLYFLAMPAANVELRLTTKKSRDAEDHSGVLIFGFTVGGSLFMKNADALGQMFGVDEVEDYMFGNFAISWFPVDGAAVNLLSYSRSWGNDIPELKDSLAFGLTLYPGIF